MPSLPDRQPRIHSGHLPQPASGLAEIDNRREWVISYQMSAQWVAGKSHLIADGLSCYPIGEQLPEHISAHIAVVPADLEQFATSANAIADYKQLIDNVKMLTLDDLKNEAML